YKPVTALRRCSGTGSASVSRTSARAAAYARSAELLFGAVGRYSAASASGRYPSGMPTKCAACCAATATPSACGSANPASSAARIPMRPATNSRASRASSLRERKGDSAEAALTIEPSSIDELRDVVAAQRLQAHHARSREQRRVHLERWVLRRGPEKGDQAGLDMREHRVLL